jgi:hypothetical protein
MVDADDADHGMHPEQLIRRPTEAVRFGAMPVNEVEGVSPNANPSVSSEPGAGIAVGREAEEGLAPALRSGRQSRSFLS